MRSDALEFLACPICGGALIADAEAPAGDGHIMSGTLVSGCGAQFAIREGIPRLVATQSGHAPEQTLLTTAERFATEWSLFDQRAQYYEQQFLDWVDPLEAGDFAGRLVFEGGCGKGRHTALVASYGARAVVAIDLGNAVDVAFAATRHLSNVHIAQGNIVTPPVGRVFDIGFSIGVLHHLPVPQDGFRGLYDRVRPGGRVAIWVYGRESNEWIVRYIDPLRTKITSRLPEQILYWLSLPPAVALRGALAAYRQAALAKHLPYGAYLGYISRFPLREVHHILFDQLVTPVAHYVPREEVARWLGTGDLDDVTISWHNKNSWRAAAMVRCHRDSARDKRPRSAS